MINNSKCTTQKILKKKKPQKCPQFEQNLNKKKKNKLHFNNIQNNSSSDLHNYERYVKQLTTHIQPTSPTIHNDKAKQIEQRFSNYTSLIKQYEKYKVKDSNNIYEFYKSLDDRNQLKINQKDQSDSKYHHKTTIVNNFNNSMVFNKTIFKGELTKYSKQSKYQQQTSKIENIKGHKEKKYKKTYSSVKNLLDQSKSHKTQTDHILLHKNSPQFYRQNQTNQQHKSIKSQQKPMVIENSQSPKHFDIKMRKSSFKSHNTQTLKQLQHKYMLLTQNYNKSLKLTKQTNENYQKQKQYLMKIKTQHFQNQQLIQRLMYMVRNRDYLHQNDHKHVSYGLQILGDIKCDIINESEFIKQRQNKVLKDCGVQSQPQGRFRKQLSLCFQEIEKQDYKALVTKQSNFKQLKNLLQIYQPQNNQKQYPNTKSQVKTYSQLEQPSLQNQKETNHLNQSKQQNDSNSISDLRKDLFNVKSLINENLNLKSYLKLCQETQHENRQSQFLQKNDGVIKKKENKRKKQLEIKDQIMDNMKKDAYNIGEKPPTFKTNKYRFQPSISISIEP